MSTDPLTNIQNGHVVGETLVNAGYLGEGFLNSMPDEEIASYADYLAGQFDVVSEESQTWFAYGIEEAIRDARQR